MDMIDPPVARYAAEHTSAPGPHLAGVAAATREQTQTPGMMSGIVVARLLEALVVATRARRVLEIGTFTGYGALSIAARLPADGTVITLEADAGRADMAIDDLAQYVSFDPHALAIRGNADQLGLAFLAKSDDA